MADLLDAPRQCAFCGSTLVLMDEHKRACLEAMYVEHHHHNPPFRSMWLPPPVSVAGNWTSIVSRWTRRRTTTTGSWTLCLGSHWSTAYRRTHVSLRR